MKYRFSAFYLKRFVYVWREYGFKHAWDCLTTDKYDPIEATLIKGENK